MANFHYIFATTAGVPSGFPSHRAAALDLPQLFRCRPCLEQALITSETIGPPRRPSGRGTRILYVLRDKFGVSFAAANDGTAMEELGPFFARPILARPGQPGQAER